MAATRSPAEIEICALISSASFQQKQGELHETQPATMVAAVADVDRLRFASDSTEHAACGFGCVCCASLEDLRGSGALRGHREGRQGRACQRIRRSKVGRAGTR